MKQFFMFISVLFVFAMFSGNSWAQKSKSPEQKQKEADERKESQKKEELEAIEKGKKRHMKLQDKKTRKRMKKSKKKADRVNANKKPPIWERIQMNIQRRKRG